MSHAESRAGHTFHIPVMGTGFTADTPIRVAKYGISSVISLVDDVLLDQMRRVHSIRAGMPFEEIPANDEDVRARRITGYLNLVKQLVEAGSAALRSSPFEEGSEIWRYFTMLPEVPLKRAFRDMLATSDPAEKERMQQALRERALPGSIDVNIMTKLDRDSFRYGKRRAPEFADAMSALRGFARSSLQSSIVLSAGMNQRLYRYVSQFDDFLPDASGCLQKKVILKVSDYRSAAIQGKLLAKRGVWVSEYRIESGLNCGGHAFATKGLLMGPILEEFKRNRMELQESTHAVFNKALVSSDRDRLREPLPMRITAQGGIGTSDEQEFLLKYYDLDGAGWGTPFLLVPEVTNVDESSLERLCAADERSVRLSDSSPLGVPFWNLTSSASEEARRKRISEGRPGSQCPKGFLAANTDYTKIPICTASRAYQKQELARLKEEQSEDQLAELTDRVIVKSCICHDLGGGATLKNDVDPASTPAVCCGPNIVNFSKIASLEEMIDHIYGRISLLARSERPHMFLAELKLYVSHLGTEIEQISKDLSERTPKYVKEFKDNLQDGIQYYKALAEEFIEPNKTKFLDELKTIQSRLEELVMVAEFRPSI